jgi:hypothetical protein
MKSSLVCGTVEHDANPVRWSITPKQVRSTMRSILRPNVLMLALVIVALTVAFLH